VSGREGRATRQQERAEGADEHANKLFLLRSFRSRANKLYLFALFSLARRQALSLCVFLARAPTSSFSLRFSRSRADKLFLLRSFRSHI
jgi:hypothetical protein